MRIRNLIIGDIKFQFKYGFYLIYVVFTLFYITLLYAVPAQWRQNTATIMIYSDPAAMGLFFMGAIVLLEKSQRVLNSIAVSPVKVSEYIFSKIISIGLISTCVGILIAVSAGTTNLFIVIIGTFLGSAVFSLLGLIVAVNISSLNQFLVATVPIEIICFALPMCYIFGYDKTFMLIHPGCILIRFIHGNGDSILPLLVILFVWIGILYFITYCNVKKMFQRVGGITL
jgi:fluoroquinolone transport system permease protein